MKLIYKEWLLAFVLGMVVPGLVLGAAVKYRSTAKEYNDPIAAVKNGEIPKLSVDLLLPDGSIQTMDLEEYLVGVVLGEMPASFETEALKAQAVVARTYTLKCAEAGVKHGTGIMCSDAACCQAYAAPEDYGGWASALAKVRSAVTETAGEVLTYNGNLIEATYFSCSGGITEDAVAVWGTDYPYLRSVESPGEEAAVHYTDSVYFTADEFLLRLDRELTGSPKTWLGFVTYTAGGGVNTIRIGGVDYKGTEIRAKLGLRSTAFTMTADEEGIAVNTKGFGHRVGMSQYGADAMALRGCGYEEILTHYYQGTSLTLYEN